MPEHRDIHQSLIDNCTWLTTNCNRTECFLLINIVKSRKTAYMRDSLYKNNWLINLNYVNMFTLARSLERIQTGIAHSRKYDSVVISFGLAWNSLQQWCFQKDIVTEKAKVSEGQSLLHFFKLAGHWGETTHSHFHSSTKVAFAAQKQSRGHMLPRAVILWI